MTAIAAHEDLGHRVLGLGIRFQGIEDHRLEHDPLRVDRDVDGHPVAFQLAGHLAQQFQVPARLRHEIPGPADVLIGLGGLEQLERPRLETLDLVGEGPSLGDLPGFLGFRDRAGEMILMPLERSRRRIVMCRYVTERQSVYERPINLPAFGVGADRAGPRYVTPSEPHQWPP